MASTEALQSRVQYETDRYDRRVPRFSAVLQPRGRRGFDRPLRRAGARHEPPPTRRGRTRTTQGHHSVATAQHAVPAHTPAHHACAVYSSPYKCANTCSNTSICGLTPGVLTPLAVRQQEVLTRKKRSNVGSQALLSLRDPWHGL